MTTTASEAARKAWVTRRNQTAAAPPTKPPVSRILDYGKGRRTLLQVYRCLLEQTDERDIVEGLRVEDLAELLELATRQTQRVLHQLAADGFIEILPRFAGPDGRQQPNAYRVVLSK